MKLKAGFILQDVAGETVVLPVGGDLDTNMMITLNGTARFLWERMEQEVTQQQLVDALLGEYEVDQQTAQLCVERFVEELKKNDFLA